MTYGDGVANVDIAARLPFIRPWQAGHSDQRSASWRVSAALGFKDTKIYSFQEKPKTRAGGSTADSSSFAKNRSMHFTTIRRCSNANRSRRLSNEARFKRSSIMASGRRWIRFATSSSWKSSGAQERPHGRPGKRRIFEQFLERPPRLSYWTHRLQGRLAGFVARQLGASVRGYALDPWTDPNLFSAACVGDVVDDVRGDIRDATGLDNSMREFRPEVVFHLAAQPLVRRSYEDPIGTYETNVIGTARVLDAVRRTPSVRAVVSVTTDKCYENKEWVWPYRETDPLGGYDPYSSSKACAEIVAALSAVVFSGRQS